MKVHYDDQVDALYLELGDETPDGVMELSDGVGLDTTPEGRLGASKFSTPPAKSI